MSPKDSSPAAGSAGESDRAEFALRLIHSKCRHEPVAAVAMIGFARKRERSACAVALRSHQGCVIAARPSALKSAEIPPPANRW